MFPASHSSRARLPALALMITALTLGACHNASAPTLPTAPESASGYRTDLQTRHASRNTWPQPPTHWLPKPGARCCVSGGSAIDAAIAMQAVLTLVEPQSSGIGGGALIVLLGWSIRTHLRRARNRPGRRHREAVPAGRRPTDAVHPGTDRRALRGYARACCERLSWPISKHGRLPWAQLFEPAIHLAEQGFVISPRLHRLIAADSSIRDSAEMTAYFLNADGSPKASGTLLKNPPLGRCVATHRQGRAGCAVQRPIAQEIVTKVQGHANPGSLSLNDLASYSAKERAPLVHRLQALAGLRHAATVVGRDRRGADPRHAAGPGDTRQALGPGAAATAQNPHRRRFRTDRRSRAPDQPKPSAWLMPIARNTWPTPTLCQCPSRVWLIRLTWPAGRR